MTSLPAHTLPLRIALLGATATGKTQLAAELTATLGRERASPALVLFADNPPLAFAPRASTEETFHHALLMGLDLLAENNETGNQQEADDQRLREALCQANIPYTVIYGKGPARLASALDALRGLTGSSTPPRPENKERQPWGWACDTCSDPGCERRLLSDLLAGRKT